MGRLPGSFNGHTIKARTPYNLPGELTVAGATNGAQFPDAVFFNGTDRPFEIHRMKVRITGLDSATPPLILEPQPTTLMDRVRLRIEAVRGNELFNRNPILASALPFDNTGWWDWEEPYTIVNQQGMNISADVLALPLVCVNQAAAGQACNSIAVQVGSVRIEVNFQGYLVTIAAPSETR